ncbi:L-rhamnonate dehydratase [Bryobacter aggregatus]|uniref:L-rhamnonate dehydratase n=1 Tax=Bryobacter aggregatus TaxID=360054 RepID=UPI0004E1988B|nr:L-rhamnonate dehydratase [Bryobacter aggregatus]
MGLPFIRSIRAYTVRGGGGDYHDQASGHWIDGQVATPMSKYPEYRQTRRSFGLNVLGSLVVVVEASDGSVGFGVSTGGDIGCFIVEEHLSRFVIGKPVDAMELIWDQMFHATLFYGRKGIVLSAISAVDLALWDLLGQVRREPVYQLLGGPVREEIEFYATGVRPDIAKELGFLGGKMPLRFGPSDGDAGLRQNLEALARVRDKVGDAFWLMLDCWMGLDLDYAVALGTEGRKLGLKWIEECLPPDDYWGYAELKKRVPRGLLVTTGEHEATRWGFRMLVEMECCDIIQPDVGWCGGLTELLQITKLAAERGLLVIPHGSSVYSYHFVVTQQCSPFAEFLMMSPGADVLVPMFSPLLLDEPVPVGGRLRVPDRPGFGVRLNPEVKLIRPVSCNR